MSVCAICGGEEAFPKLGHKLPFCRSCFAAWEQSPEYQQMVSARQRFVDRRKRERGS